MWYNIIINYLFMYTMIQYDLGNVHEKYDYYIILRLFIFYRFSYGTTTEI